MPRERKSSGLDLPPFEYADRVTSQETARNCFCEAIVAVAPEVLQDLARTPWQHFQGIKAPLPEVHNVLEDIRGGMTGAQVWPQVPWKLTPELEQALTSWQSKYNLTEMWCRERALWTLARWRREANARGKQWEYSEPQPALRVIPGDDPAACLARDWPLPFELRLWGWDPRHERWDSWITRADIDGKLSAYRRRVEEAVGQAGLVRTPGKRELPHFEWLARHQVQGWSYEKIRREYNIWERKTIEDGVKRTAAMAGVALQNAKAGRPVGVKELRSRRRALRQ
ncbi:MAG: hypothetical protein ACHQ9S_26615 [Candidatus Binatia bacterium]